MGPETSTKHCKIKRNPTCGASSAITTTTKYEDMAHTGCRAPLEPPQSWQCSIPVFHYPSTTKYMIIFIHLNVKTKLSGPPRRSIRYYSQRDQWVLRPAKNNAKYKEIAHVSRHQPLQPLQNKKKWHMRGVMRLQNHYKAANAVSHYSTIPVLPNIRIFNHFNVKTKLSRPPLR